VNQLVSAGVSTAVVGLNKGWKQDINIGKKNNQNFVMIPHSKAIEMLAYKLELEGIELIVNEESYTSKASFLDGDFIPVYKEGDDTNHKFSGYRKVRGLYKSKQHGIINADLNGAYNILRKAIPTGYSNGIEGLAVTPRLLYIA
jgi:putative transposase